MENQAPAMTGGDLETIKDLEGKVKALIEGRFVWPMPCFSQNFDYEGIGTASKDQILATMNRLFKVLGGNFEEFVILSGFWDPTMNEAKLIGNAEKLVKHHQR